MTGASGQLNSTAREASRDISTDTCRIFKFCAEAVFINNS